MLKKFMIGCLMTGVLALGASQLMAKKVEPNNLQECDGAQYACCASIYSGAPVNVCLDVWAGAICIYTDGHRINYVCQ